MLLTRFLGVVSLTLFFSHRNPHFVDCTLDLDLAVGRRTVSHGSHSHHHDEYNRPYELIANLTKNGTLDKNNTMDHPTNSSSSQASVAAESSSPIQQVARSPRSKHVVTFQPPGATNKSALFPNPTIQRRTPIVIKKIPRVYKAPVPGSEFTPSGHNLSSSNDTVEGGQSGASASGGPNNRRIPKIVLRVPGKKGFPGSGPQMTSTSDNGNFSSSTPPTGNEKVIVDEEDFEIILKPKSNGTTKVIVLGDDNSSDKKTGVPSSILDGENGTNIDDENQKEKLSEAAQTINNQRTNIKYEQNVVINNFYDGDKLVFVNGSTTPVEVNSTASSEPGLAPPSYPPGNGNFISMANQLAPTPQQLNNLGSNNDKANNGTVIHNFYNTGDKLVYENSTNPLHPYGVQDPNTVGLGNSPVVPSGMAAFGPNA